MVNEKKKRIKNLCLDTAAFLTGSLLYAVSVNMFTAPNNIAPGGLTGAATMINYVTDGMLPIGTTIILLNIPIFIWALCTVGFQFVAKTIAATVMSSLAIDLTAGILPEYHGDVLIITVFGGLLSGLGLALIFLRGGTTGGTDLIANLVGRYFRHLSLGRLMMVIDMLIVVVSAFVYRTFESPMYAAIIIFINSRIIDTVLYGANSGTGKMMFIISPRNSEIANEIMEKIDRGVTELHSRGCYSGQENGVLLCAVKRQEVYRAYDIVHSLDPDAFIIVGEAGEITGEGFRAITPSHAAEKKKKREERKQRKQNKSGQKNGRV